VGIRKAKKLIDLFLATHFEGGRHIDRLNTIKEIENKYSK
jgi:ribose 5-phosphate isomerase RpiB